MDFRNALPVPKIKGFGIVRRADGTPKIDDPDNLPDEIKRALTEADREYLGLK